MSEPFIKISLNRVRQNARRFLDCARSVFDTHQVEIFYAMKANPDHAVLTTIATAGFGIEVINPAQLTQVRGLGVPVIASGFLKPPALYQANALHHVSYLVIENVYELPALEQAWQHSGQRQRVLLRIKASEHAKIGCDLAQIQRLCQSPALEVIGLHFHAGWNVTDDAVIRQILHSMAEARNVLEAVGTKVGVLNFGGSFCEHGADPDQLPRRMQLYRDMLNPDPAVAIHFEPGRYLVGDAGVVESTIHHVDQANKVICVDTCAYGYRLTGGTPEVVMQGVEQAPESWTIYGFWPAESDLLRNVVLHTMPQVGQSLQMRNFGAYVDGLEAQFSVNGPVKIIYAEAN